MSSCSSLLSVINPVIIILFFAVAITAQQSSNVALGSVIVANADATPTWRSPSGGFAFGFRQVAPGAYLLAIWFDQIPQKPVVWSANRDDLLPSGSRVQLSLDGALELFHQRGQRVWAANTARSATVAYATLLDTGNLVLAGNTSTSAIFLWQSFDAPTNTLLPGQILNRGGLLISSFSDTNHSRGRFRLAFQTKGNLELYTTKFPFDDNNSPPYWSTPTLETGFRLIFNQSGNIYFTRSNGTFLRPLFDNGADPVGQYQYQRLTLDHDGVLRHYVYANTSTAWSIPSFAPSNICLSLWEEYNGGGPCGFNSICSMGNDGRPNCDCPLGYSPRGGLSGCGPDFEQHRCDQQWNETGQQQFRLNDHFNTDWPLMDYAIFKNVAEEWCRQSCLDDCQCAAVVYDDRQGYCYKKSLPLINGRRSSAFTGKALVKIRINSTTASNIPNTTSTSAATYTSSNNSTPIIALSVVLGCFVLFFLLSSLFFIFYFNRRKWMWVRESRAHPAGVNVIRKFSFNELEEATNGFEEELGRGACSIVYKGALKLKDDGKHDIAVKKLNKIAKESDFEFQAEVSSISRTNHINLVQLQGYCEEGQHRILVYEFMTNGSLANILFENSSRPSWCTRVHIAFATARGLCYLHEECTASIIHCDIKPQNVLLDEAYTPKIADFGLAKLLRSDQTRTITGIRGTRGYVAPEWFRNLPITVKVDVYSFGILLLELVCCRKNYVPDAEDEGEVVLADWAYDCYQQRAFEMLVAGDEEAKNDMKVVERLVSTAIWCIQEDPTLRPHMNRVVHMLQGSLEVPAPPDPSL